MPETRDHLGSALSSLDANEISLDPTLYSRPCGSNKPLSVNSTSSSPLPLIQLDSLLDEFCDQLFIWDRQDVTDTTHSAICRDGFQEATTILPILSPPSDPVHEHELILADQLPGQSIALSGTMVLGHPTCEIPVSPSFLDRFDVTPFELSSLSVDDQNVVPACLPVPILGTDLVHGDTLPPSLTVSPSVRLSPSSSIESSSKPKHLWPLPPSFFVIDESNWAGSCSIDHSSMIDSSSSVVFESVDAGHLSPVDSILFPALSLASAAASSSCSSSPPTLSPSSSYLISKVLDQPITCGERGDTIDIMDLYEFLEPETTMTNTSTNIVKTITDATSQPFLDKPLTSLLEDDDIMTLEWLVTDPSLLALERPLTDTSLVIFPGGDVCDRSNENISEMVDAVSTDSALCATETVISSPPSTVLTDADIKFLLESLTMPTQALSQSPLGSSPFQPRMPPGYLFDAVGSVCHNFNPTCVPGPVRLSTNGNNALVIPNSVNGHFVPPRSGYTTFPVTKSLSNNGNSSTTPDSVMDRQHANAYHRHDPFRRTLRHLRHLRPPSYSHHINPGCPFTTSSSSSSSGDVHPNFVPSHPQRRYHHPSYPPPSFSSSSTSSSSQPRPPLPFDKDSEIIPHQRRRRLSASESSYLLTRFRDNDKPSAQDRDRFAKQLSLDRKTIQVWFQNRRAKLKRDQKSNRDRSGASGNSTVDGVTVQVGGVGGGGQFAEDFDLEEEEEDEEHDGYGDDGFEESWLHQEVGDDYWALHRRQRKTTVGA